MSKRISVAAMVHLEEELGEDRATFLFDSTNTDWVKEQVDAEMARRAVETKSSTTNIDLNSDIITLQIGKRTYEVFKLLKSGETSVRGPAMEERAKEMGAHLGKEDGLYIQNHDDDIPAELRYEIFLVFPGWRRHYNPDGYAYLKYQGQSSHDDGWFVFWNRLGNLWLDKAYLVRRK